MPSIPVNRRDFLKVAGATSASLTLGLNPLSREAQAQMATPPAAREPGTSFVMNGKRYPRIDPETGEALFHEPIRIHPYPDLPREPRALPVNLLEHQPQVLTSRNGLLEVDLEASIQEVMLNGQRVSLRTYNGTFPAPSLYVKPGDELRIRHINNMPPEPPMPHHNINHPHGFNDINLHTHGWNTSPMGNEDNVLLVTRPGEVFENEHFLGADHPGGTYWYHPHKHGSTALQVGSGMGGFLIVSDPENDPHDIRAVPEIAAAREVLLMFQEIFVRDRPDGGGELNEFPVSVAHYFYDNAIRQEQTVNGVACNEMQLDGSMVFPEIRMRPGEVQHWRMCHGGIFNNWPLEIEGHEMHIVAYDGMTLEEVETVKSFVFVSGQRRDILVKASMTPGTYAVKRRRYKQSVEVNSWQEQVLFNIVVEGSPVNMALPTKLNPPSKRLPYIKDNEIVAKREISFKFVDNTAEGIFLYLIDGKVFKPGRVDHAVALNTCEEWTIVNGPASEHPFHIHVNWFEVHKVVDGDGNETVYDPPIWMDTVNVPMEGSVTMRMRMENFQGLSVFHCHLLSHEDEGMMALFEIVDTEPKTMALTREGGMLVSPEYDHRVKVHFHHDSVDRDTEVSYQYNFSPAVDTQVNPAPAVPPGVAIYDRFFNLSATQGGEPIQELRRAAIVEIDYSAAQVDEFVAPGAIRLYRFDEDTEQWSDADISVVSRTPNKLVCTTRKLGRFGVLGTTSTCLDFAYPEGIGEEDVDAMRASIGSPYEYFIKPHDVAPAGNPDGVIDDADLLAVVKAQGSYCPGW